MNDVKVVLSGQDTDRTGREIACKRLATTLDRELTDAYLNISLHLRIYGKISDAINDVIVSRVSVSQIKN
jgi:hypothetical protein